VGVGPMIEQQLALGDPDDLMLMGSPRLPAVSRFLVGSTSTNSARTYTCSMHTCSTHPRRRFASRTLFPGEFSGLVQKSAGGAVRPPSPGTGVGVVGTCVLHPAAREPPGRRVDARDIGQRIAMPARCADVRREVQLWSSQQLSQQLVSLGGLLSVVWPVRLLAAWSRGVALAFSATSSSGSSVRSSVVS
jgi:hypothetical protein